MWSSKKVAEAIRCVIVAKYGIFYILNQNYLSIFFKW